MLLEAQAEANRTLNSAATSVAIIRKKAESQALAITRQYAAWQSMYANVKSSQGARRARDARASRASRRRTARARDDTHRTSSRAGTPFPPVPLFPL